MVNMATYIGSSQGGLLGSLVATTAVVLPSFIIILVVTVLLKTVLQNRYVQAVLQGLKPCVTGIILATGIHMVLRTCIGNTPEFSLNTKAIIITLLLVLIKFGWQRIHRKKLDPIALILISALIGIGIYSL